MVDRLRMPVFWVVVASGLGVILAEQGEVARIGLISLAFRTVFWCSAIAYFSLRIYGWYSAKRTADDTPSPGDSSQGQ